jgi:hypothetical protein
LDSFLNWNELDIYDCLNCVGRRGAQLQLPTPSLYLKYKNHIAVSGIRDNQMDYIEQRTNLKHTQAGLFTHFTAQSVKQ